MIEQPTVPDEVLADMQAVVDALASGQRVDEETYRRIRERGTKLSKELHQRFGETDMAVELIREARNEKFGMATRRCRAS